MRTVREAVESDLAKLPPDLAQSALAALALVLAGELDSQGNSATSKSMNARALLDTLERLRELTPPPVERGPLDELTERRARRLGGKAGAASKPGS